MLRGAMVSACVCANTHLPLVPSSVLRESGAGGSGDLPELLSLNQLVLRLGGCACILVYVKGHITQHVKRHITQHVKRYSTRIPCRGTAVRSTCCRTSSTAHALAVPVRR